MPASRWVTLTTDFGPVYAAQVKAVLTTCAPGAKVVELSDELPAHRVSESAFVLAQMAAGFPRGTIHLAVVDPGVGGTRAPIVIQCPGNTFLVGPDNGLLDPLAQRLGGGKAFRIDRGRVPGPVSPSVTFDGRDLFAPAAALLARGRRLGSFATPTHHRRLGLPQALRRPRETRGEVLHVDRFGNLISNIPADWHAVGSAVRVRVGTSPPRTLTVVRSYADLRPAALGILGSSFGTLEVSVRDGPADRRLHARVGTPIRLANIGSPSKYPGR